MPSAIDYINPKIERGRKVASVPAVAVMGELYAASLPDASKSFSAIIEDLQEYTKDLFRRKAPDLVEPTGSAFNNCNGQWAEYIYSVQAWNKLAEINQSLTGEHFFVYAKLPSNRNATTSWVSLLKQDKQTLVNNFALDETVPAVSASGHEKFLLSSSNPDAVILTVKEDILGQLALDPKTRIDNLSMETAEKLNCIFDNLKNKINPFREIQCFISIKNSMRPDRRLQFLHEGNNVKSLLLFLINAERYSSTPQNPLPTLTSLDKKFYAVSLNSVTEQDRKAMDAAFIGAVQEAPSFLIWAVDQLFETIHPNDIPTQIEAMVQ